MFADPLWHAGKGVFKPSGPGTLRFSFSNAHSLFRGKTVYLRVLDNVGEVEARIRSRSPYTTSKAYGAVGEEVDGGDAATERE